MKRMVKGLFLFSMLFGMCALASTPRAISAEEEGTTIVEPVIGEVVINKTKGGDVLLDVESGEVGTVVTATINPNLFYIIESVTVNGVNLVAQENGTYKFELVEGSNVLSVSFVVDHKEMEKLAETITNVKDNGVASILTVENLIIFLYWVLTFAMSTGLFITLGKNKKIKSKTARELYDAAVEACNVAGSKEVKTFFNENLTPLLTKYDEKLEVTNSIMKTMVRCMLLAQENTPEARLAVIKELTELKTNEEDLAKEVKAMIDNEVKKIEEQNQKRDEAIAELKATNDNITNTSGNKYGQI